MTPHYEDQERKKKSTVERARRRNGATITKPPLDCNTNNKIGKIKAICVLKTAFTAA